MDLATRQRILGIIALLLLIAAGVLLFGFEGSLTDTLGSICLRAGTVLLLTWLALPQLLSLSFGLPPRLLIALLVGFALVVARPKLFPIAAAIVLAVAILEFVGWVLRPFPEQRNGKSKSRSNRS